MPSEARKRAERCRERSDECKKLAALATDEVIRKEYLDLAEKYIQMAVRESNLARYLKENLDPTKD